MKREKRKKRTHVKEKGGTTQDIGKIDVKRARNAKIKKEA
jgi:hypothetical protein